jgi:hypothetical protein
MQQPTALCAVMLSGFLALALWSQSSDAIVSGEVLDPSGAPVPDVAISAENVETGVVSHSKSNNSGVYLFPALQPGSYRLTAEREGFQKFVYNDFVLDVGAQLTVNVALKIGRPTETVEVEAAAEQLQTSNASVGVVITAQKLLELPLVGRNAYDLIGTQAGTSGANGQNFNGTRAGALNIMIDGITARDNFVDSLARSITSATVTVDRVEEFRIITSPADAELGRGSGQIQAISRGGTNKFHGSLFEEHRDTDLTTNTWFNNQRGTDPNTGQALSPRPFLVRNQYGGRAGGPIRRNKTFFHFHYEGSRQVSRNSVNSVVYTPTARQGIYRFFPGARNGNALALAPTVNLAGNPVQPVGATDALQTVSLFGRDPNRLTPDSSGVIAKEVGYMPLPNNYLVGDGLNTAGYTFQLKSPVNFYEWDTRIDHQFTGNHRLSFSYSRQAYDSVNVSAPQNYPGVPGATATTGTDLYSLSLVSVLRSNLLNEFRAGVFRPSTTVIAPYAANGVLPQVNGQPFIVHFITVTDPIPYSAYGQTDPSYTITPVYQFTDTLTWQTGRHSFKGGFEVRFTSYAGYDLYAATPRVALGALTVPVQNIGNIPGIGVNQAAAQQMLAELSGTVSQAFQTENANGKDPRYLPGLSRYRHLRSPELTGFFKDDFKITPNLTLNIGVRYEYYSPPVETNGLALSLVGGGGIFGISGNSLAAEFQPGLMQGSLSLPLPIGPHTANPDTTWYKASKLNFAPAIGLSWSPSGDNAIWGRKRAVIRAGYTINYERDPFYLALSTVLGPGYSSTPVFIPTTLQGVGNVQLPLAPSSAPLQPVPLTDRSTVEYAYDSNLKQPYYQNWNFSIQRAFGNDATFEARYVGTKGTRLVRSANINEVNVFENGILNAFKITQAGGSSPLLNSIFNGLATGGSTVNGTTFTGSDYVRSFGTTAAFLANNDVGGFANFLNSSTLAGPAGQLLRRAGLPENFVVVNPQFGTQTFLISNFGNSDYHALQLNLTKRFAAGWIFQANYTWSKALGDEEGDESAFRTDIRTLRNRSLDKRVLYFNHAHVFHANGIWELPFGPGKLIGRGTHGILAKVIGGWQTGAIATVQSGAPLSLYAQNTFSFIGGGFQLTNTPYTPEAIAAVPKDLGGVSKTGNGVVYFSGLHQVPDPSIQLIASPAIRAQSILQAITSSSGQLLLANGLPGQLGNLSPNFITGPGLLRVDLNLMKRFKIAETKEILFRADATNFTNTPQFGAPDSNINSPNFGRITDTVAGSNRVIVVGARFTF